MVNLNSTLETYFASVKKYDGNNYEPSSLGNMEAAIDRYLLEKGLTISILKDKEFKGARDVIEGRARYFREELGLGRKPNRARSLNFREEGELWSAGQLGDQNSRSLLYTMWYMLTQHLGLRGRQEHYSKKIEDFVLNKAEQGTEYITYSEGVTKTRHGGTRQKQRLVVPKMFQTGGDHCPVKLFKTFASRRPE